jgi:hypothetical protein
VRCLQYSRLKTTVADNHRNRIAVESLVGVSGKHFRGPGRTKNTIFFKMVISLQVFYL